MLYDVVASISSASSKNSKLTDLPSAPCSPFTCAAPSLVTISGSEPKLSKVLPHLISSTTAMVGLNVHTIPGAYHQHVWSGAEDGMKKGFA